MVSFVALLALSASALASPVALQERETVIPNNWHWSVTGWEASCIRSLCTYLFNVTVPSVENISGVSATCIGYENGGYKKENTYADCDVFAGAKNNEVAAKFSTRPAEGDNNPGEIFVSFKQLGDGKSKATYTYAGRAGIVFNHGLYEVPRFEIGAENVTAVL
ncbi:hypothetical protein CFE70_005015 [Pyrenophora teres f. teres 0-1]|uniref:Uncharacterized protein n=1 Tax=Pyrenophora teres f. teres (strain 0-1) TaxID=861557 RepID=E3RP82_PYRTT|nr:hypothetical protein PTT_10429 [Pyrenophora teres f. teres 0-1]KAE8871067.1 hypothetical protein PTNB73_02526 [Pyrenophora teres f. teres]KAK1909436.1 hypothetical protein P3342_007605 [Pyrenophora teres f. teres]